MAQEARKGQDVLYGFLSAWQASLDNMAAPHADSVAAAAELRGLHAAAKAQLAKLEGHAAAVDQVAASKKAPEKPSTERLAKRDELRGQIDERQKQLKVVIDRLHAMQDDICALTCVAMPLEGPDKVQAFDRSSGKIVGKSKV